MCCFCTHADSLHCWSTALFVNCIVAKVLLKPLTLEECCEQETKCVPVYILRAAGAFLFKQSMYNVHLSLQSKNFCCGSYTVALWKLRWVKLWVLNCSVNSPGWIL